MMNARFIPILATLALSAGSVTAQIDLPDDGDRPRRVPERPERGGGDLAPHLVCMVCGARNYTAPRTRPASEEGTYFAVCAYCRKDRRHREGGRGTGGDLDLPDRPRRPAPKPGPTSRDPSVPDLPEFPSALSARTRFILEEFAKTDAPTDSLRLMALRSLKALGDEGVLAGRVALRDERAPLIYLGGSVLIESGRGAEIDRVAQRLCDPLPGHIGPSLLDLLVATDPVHASPQLLCALLEHPRGPMRQAAARHLGAHSSPALLRPLEDALKSKRTATRIAAINIIATIDDPLSVDLLLKHLADSSPTVCGRVLDHLAGAEDERLDVELLRRAFNERWILRPSAYALLAVMDREDIESRTILDERHAPSLLTGLESSDPLVRGTCAAALAGIGFRSESSGSTEWVDDLVPTYLIAAVSGVSFHSDYASLQPRALRRLELITGEQIGTDGGRWVDWWTTRREGFHALRASFPVALHEVSRMVIRYRDKGGAFAIAGFDAPSPTGPEERIVIGATQMAALVASLREVGVLSPQHLPGLRGRRSSVERELSLRVLDREKVFRFGRGEEEEWFTEAVAILSAQRERQRWQRFAPEPAENYGSWEAEALWWDSEQDERARASRLKRLVLTYLEGRAPSQRHLGLVELERVLLVDGVASIADFEPLLGLIQEEAFYTDRCRRLVDITRDLIRGDTTSMWRARQRLIRALLENFKDAAAESVAAVISDVDANQRLSMASDERPIVRALVAMHYSGSQLPEERAVLLALLDDPELSVEAAAVSSLGHARLEGARTELLVRARIGEGVVRLAALEAIGRLGGEGVRQALVTGLAERDEVVQLSALRGLTFLEDPQSISLFISYIQQDPDSEIFEVAMAALEGFGVAAHRDLLRIAESSVHKARRRAALLLSDAGVGEVADALALQLAGGPDPEVARELSILTCFDLREAEQPASEYLNWLRSEVDRDAWRWFVQATARRELKCPPQRAFGGGGSRATSAFLLEVIERCEPFLAERARRELKRSLDTELVELPLESSGRELWLEHARALVDRVHGGPGGEG